MIYYKGKQFDSRIQNEQEVGIAFDCLIISFGKSKGNEKVMGMDGGREKIEGGEGRDREGERYIYEKGEKEWERQKEREREKMIDTYSVLHKLNVAIIAMSLHSSTKKEPLSNKKKQT